MRRQDDGRPLPALLLLCSMFAFAFVFHIVTRPDDPLAAHFNTQIAAFTAPTTSIPAAVPGPDAVTAETLAPAPFSPLPTPVNAPEPLEAPLAPNGKTPQSLQIQHTATSLPASAFSPIATPLPSAVDPAAIDQTTPAAGAVTRAFATTRSALQGAFKKAF